MYMVDEIIDLTGDVPCIIWVNPRKEKEVLKNSKRIRKECTGCDCPGCCWPGCCCKNIEIANKSTQIGQDLSVSNLGYCPVCYDPLSKEGMFSTICGHVFCKPCIVTCVRNNKECPKCRKPLKLRDIHPVHLR